VEDGPDSRACVARRRVAAHRRDYGPHPVEIRGRGREGQRCRVRSGGVGSRQGWDCGGGAGCGVIGVEGGGWAWGNDVWA